VRVIHDGVTALEAATANVPDVMLIDIGLPGVDGYEVARRIRREPSLERVALVALTGYGREADRQQAMAAGFRLSPREAGEPGHASGYGGAPRDREVGRAAERAALEGRPEIHLGSEPDGEHETLGAPRERDAAAGEAGAADEVRTTSRGRSSAGRLDSGV